MSALIEGRSPTILTRRGAELLTAKITSSLDRSSRLLVQAFEGRAWEPLGFDSWEAYTAAHWGSLAAIKLERPDRDALIVGLTLEGRGRQQVATQLDTSLGTVQNVLERAGVIDLSAKRAARAARQAEAVAEAVVEPPLAEPPPELSKRDRAWQLIAEQGERGLTALELAEVTGWTGGSATGTTSDLKRQGRITPTRQFRRGYAADRKSVV